MESSPLYFRSADVQRAHELAEEAQYLDKRKDPRAIEKWLEAAALYEAAARRVPREELWFTRWLLGHAAVECFRSAGEQNRAELLKSELFGSDDERASRAAYQQLRELAG